jgi:hypothetical protein
MKVEIVNRSIDRQLLTAMVTSSLYLREVRDIYDSAFFSASYMQVVAGWCFSYFQKYEEAPGRHIQDLYDGAVRGELDTPVSPDDLELVQKFLLSIASEYDATTGLNIPFLLDETERWWRKQDLKQLMREVEDLLHGADTEEAERLIRQHKRIERAVAEGMDVFHEPEKLKILFDSPQTPLIEFEGALGEIINPWMTRDQLIADLAPPKAGKTALLVEACIRGVAARCNVALFETGDLSEQQTLARIYSNLTGMCTDDRYTGEHMISVPDCLRNQIGDCTKRCRVWTGAIRGSADDPFPKNPHKGWRPCNACQGTQDYQPTYGRLPFNCKTPYTPDRVEAVRKKMGAYMGSRRFRTHTTANSTISVGGIDEVLRRWKDELGFIPDIIVIDYADILAAEDDVRGGDERSKQNARWQRLRRLSQDWHCLVLVATQSDAEGFGKEDLDFKNFSEDMRKYAHATGVTASHQTEYEKEMGISRLSWILGREGQPGRMTQAVILHNHFIGRFHTGSFRRDFNYRPKYDVSHDGH